MKILIGFTGSVATVLHKKIITELNDIGNVSEINAVLTKRTSAFLDYFDENNVIGIPNVHFYTDDDEWIWNKKSHNKTKLWHKGDPILHIDLKNKSDVFVIAPCSANTLAKLANGICDNLLTTVARAWNFSKPIIIAPAMNSDMWLHPATMEHLKKLKDWGYTIIEPQSKLLACGTEGMGALADISVIVETVKKSVTWKFPMEKCTGVPVGNHPGAFAVQRKHEIHTGIDLYTNDREWVYAVEAGKVVHIGPFTGEQDKSPWWNNTDCVLVEGISGVVCYGEITPFGYLSVGQKIRRGYPIGQVKQVLKDGKERPDIIGHSKSMLHMELYPHGQSIPSDTYKKDKNILRDPTPLLLGSINCPNKLEM